MLSITDMGEDAAVCIIALLRVHAPAFAPMRQGS
jgi:hypothetical protein